MRSGKFFWISMISVVCILIMSTSNVFTNIAMAPVGATGAPGEATCAQSGCHNTNPATNSSQILLSAGSSFSGGVAPSTSYNMTVNAGNGFGRYGFSITAVDGSGNPAGTFSTNDTTKVAIQSGGNGRSYASHKNATSSNAWAIKWTSPATIPSEIFFYLAVNQANNDGANTGDAIRLATFKLSGTTLTTVTGIAPINADDASEVDIFPNPVVDNLNLSFTLADNATTTAEIYNISGQLVKALFNENLSTGSFDRTYSVRGELTEGLYLVKLQVNEQVYFKKIMVQ